MKSENVVYGLFDPRTDALRYIGQTSLGARARLRGHLCDSLRRTHTHTARWITQLAKGGMRPVVRILESCLFPEMLGDLERKWIALARKRGDALTNATDGGDGGTPGFVPSDETRAKLRARPNVWVGRKHSDESKRLMSDHCALAWSSPRLRAAQSKRHKGKVMSPESRRKSSVAGCARWATTEHRAKMMGVRRQSEQTERTKEGHRRQALAITGRKRSADAIATTAMKNHQPVIDQHGTVYGSMRAAAEALGVGQSNISAVVNRHRPHTRGYVFTLVEIAS